MKNIKTLLVIGFLAILNSCGTTQQTTATNQENKQVNNRGRSNQENTIGRTKTTDSPRFSSETEETADAIRNNKAVNKARMQEMYSSLNMDEVQIKRFENEWKQSTGSWKRSNRNKSMNNFERVEYQDRILKNILDETQFDAYQEWARENPMKD